MQRGQFITLEGGEGVGKTTNFEFIKQWLEDQKIELVTTREPGGTVFGEAVREILLGSESDDICADAELLAVFAARAEHLHKVILPALESGKWVLSDRFTDATFAYQGGGRGVSKSRIEAMEQWVQGSLRPNKVILLDAPVDVGMQRAHLRGELDRFEQESMSFFESVRQAYLARAKHDPSSYSVIDASKELTVVQSEIALCLQTYLHELQGL